MYDCNYATVYKGQLTLIVTKEEPDSTIWFLGNLTKKKQRVRESEITLIQKHGKGLTLLHSTQSLLFLINLI